MVTGSKEQEEAAKETEQMTKVANENHPLPVFLSKISAYCSEMREYRNRKAREARMREERRK